MSIWCKRAAAAGKAIFCEKPISLDYALVDEALTAVEAAGVPFMIGFNRRFDPGHRSVRDAVANGAVGELHTLRITSRDPAPPPPEYVAVSGGIFLDMVIHDFDMAPYVVGQPVTEVYARGAVRVDPQIGAGRRHRHRGEHPGPRGRHADDHRQQPRGGLRLRSAGRGLRQRRHGGVRQPLGTRAGAIGREGRTERALPWFFLDRYLESYRAGVARLPQPTSVSVRSVAGRHRRRASVHQSRSRSARSRGAKAARSSTPRSAEPMARIAVTGATGFIGGTVAAVLSSAQGHDVRCLTRRDPGGPAVAGAPWSTSADVEDAVAVRWTGP
jgi:hypothetical protein